MNMAVVEIAGKQYLVEPGNIIQTERLKGAEGDKMTFKRVLLYWDGKEMKLGRPCLEGFTVEGKLLGEKKGPKVIAYKYKRRKDYHRKVGHRQWITSVEVEKISGPGVAEPEAKVEKPKAAKPKVKAAPAKEKAIAKPKKKPAAPAAKAKKKTSTVKKASK
jgi:large subunit ribosomal protein L21